MKLICTKAQEGIVTKGKAYEGQFLVIPNPEHMLIIIFMAYTDGGSWKALEPQFFAPLS